MFWRLISYLELASAYIWLNLNAHLEYRGAFLTQVVAMVLIDTHRPLGAVILGSTSPLRIGSLRYLSQRWFSPQALTFRVPLGSWT